jgi:hypothetical protein
VFLIHALSFAIIGKDRKDKHVYIPGIRPKSGFAADNALSEARSTDSEDSEGLRGRTMIEFIWSLASGPELYK